MRSNDKKVKIVATLGPSSRKPEVIKGLIEKGVNVFRLNFSHGSHDDHLESIKMIREQSEILDCNIAVMADLQGPKIRTGNTAGDKSVTLKKDAFVTIVSNPAECNETLISIDYPSLAKEIGAGQLIMINDGAIRLRVENIDTQDNIRCKVLSGGNYSSHKGVNLPNVDLRIPSLTSKDLSDLEFILENDVQFIALSFVRKAEDIIALRKIIVEKSRDIKVIAKIEKPEAAEKIGEILNVTDGIMVARGDLGVETSPYEVPIIQKKLIFEAGICGKFVIVATQMLESMITNFLPTRAESTDVANAVIDGADAVMLSGETAVGAYPIEAVEMMNNIITITEKSDFVSKEILDLCTADKYPPHAVCEAAGWASYDLGNCPLCVFSISGETAIYLSKIRNQSPIYAFSPDQQVVKMLSAGWNITSFYLPFAKDVTTLQKSAEEILVKRDLVAKNELMIFVSGTTAVKGATDSLHVRKVGE
jgi:pyruvate kinase